jgi:undecaprenyl-diphosphatase
MNFFQAIDEKLFYFINGTLANPVFDKIMPIITNGDSWIIFLFVMWFYIVIKGGRKGRTLAIIIFLCVALSDQTSNLIKEYFGRIRPCHTLPDVHLLIGCGSGKSFPSSHAVNNFAAAVLISHFYPHLKYLIFSGAFIVAISRTFVGVHYPLDVLGGIIIGTLLGLFIVFLWELVNKKFKILKS